VFLLGQTFVLIVQCLCSSDSVKLHQNIYASPVLVTQLALLLDFSLKFDDLKVSI
jgi:CYRIA/CYRIB Rac1 binding domain